MYRKGGYNVALSDECRRCNWWNILIAASAMIEVCSWTILPLIMKRYCCCYIPQPKLKSKLRIPMIPGLEIEWRDLEDKPTKGNCTTPMCMPKILEPEKESLSVAPHRQSPDKVTTPDLRHKYNVWNIASGNSGISACCDTIQKSRFWSSFFFTCLGFINAFVCAYAVARKRKGDLDMIRMYSGVKFRLGIKQDGSLLKIKKSIARILIPSKDSQSLQSLLMLLEILDFVDVAIVALLVLTVQLSLLPNLCWSHLLDGIDTSTINSANLPMVPSHPPWELKARSSAVVVNNYVKASGARLERDIQRRVIFKAIRNPLEFHYNLRMATNAIRLGRYLGPVFGAAANFIGAKRNLKRANKEFSEANTAIDVITLLFQRLGSKEERVSKGVVAIQRRFRQCRYCKCNMTNAPPYLHPNEKNDDAFTHESSLNTEQEADEHLTDAGSIENEGSTPKSSVDFYLKLLKLSNALECVLCQTAETEPSQSFLAKCQLHQDALKSLSMIRASYPKFYKGANDSRQVKDILMSLGEKASKKLELFAKEEKRKAAITIEKSTRRMLSKVKYKNWCAHSEFRRLEDQYRRSVDRGAIAGLERRDNMPDGYERILLLEEELNEFWNKPLLLRPNTKYAVFWKKLVVACVTLELLQNVGYPLLLRHTGAASLHDCIRIMMSYPRCRIAKRKTTVVQKVLRHLNSSTVGFEEACPSPSIFRRTWIVVLAWFLYRFVWVAGTVKFLDCFVYVLEGKYDIHGSLVPKAFFERWIFPGLLFQLVVNPAMNHTLELVEQATKFVFTVGLSRALRWVAALLPLASTCKQTVDQLTKSMVAEANKNVV